jgi:electron transfer flavoprotein alpha subunit
MSVLIIVEPVNGQLNKGALELATYGKLTANNLNTNVNALVIGECTNAGELGKYGADHVYTITHDNLKTFDSQVYTGVIADAVNKLEAKVVIIRHSANGKSIEGRLAVKLNAGSVSAVNSIPDTSNGFSVKKSVYSGKAIANYSITTDVKVLSLMGNAIQPQILGNEVTPNSIELSVNSPKIKLIERKTISGKVPLPEAEKVVSAGRGMKGPENWAIVEELAEVLGATTACSRPVADTGWRPHHEHVGQTGVAIRPNLYIAIGISGAIQHLAGVNNSKTIVVINKDPEAPFFKAADYGVVGDLFEVVPKLTEAIKKFKGA